MTRTMTSTDTTAMTPPDDGLRHRPKDSAKAVYPDVMFHDDWYGKEIIRFSIHPTGYGEESLDRARQMAHGLLAACELVNRLYAIAEDAGLETIR